MVDIDHASTEQSLPRWNNGVAAAGSEGSLKFGALHTFATMEKSTLSRGAIMADFEFSTTTDDVIENLLRLHSYASGNSQERNFHFDRIYNAEHQVYYKTPEGPIFAPVKWCGAKNNSLTRYAVRKRKISQYYQRALAKIGFSDIRPGATSYTKIYSEFVDFCRGFGFKNSSAGLPHSASRPRTFWSNECIESSNTNIFPDDVFDAQSFYEGATKIVSVNAYERNQKARSTCIGHYGWTCQVCKIDFASRYGSLGNEFIHVHHITPLNEIRKEYKVDPIKDLIPVCPNCHAMIHRRIPALTIEELSQIIEKNWR